MKKIAAIKFCLGAAGGTERFLQTLIVNLPKNEYEVDAYYTNAAPYIGDPNYKHADNDPLLLSYLKDNNINLIPVHVEYKDITQLHHPWIGTNFWDLFDEKKYDLVITARAGHKEYPCCEINKIPIIEVITLAGHVDHQSNILKSIHISEFQKNKWIDLGGKVDKAVVLPLVSEIPTNITNDSFREELNIPKNCIIFGMHQRVDDGIYSPVALEAYKQAFQNNENVYFVILGGSNKYSEYAKQYDIRNFVQLSHSGDLNVIGKFLDTLDVYSHSRSDGETFGNVIREALAFGLPILSHVAPAMGHVETIGDAGFVCKTIEEYSSYMKKLYEESQHTNESNLYIDLSNKSKKRYEERYKIESIVSKFNDIVSEVMKVKMPHQMSDEEFWDTL